LRRQDHTILPYAATRLRQEASPGKTRQCQKASPGKARHCQEASPGKTRQCQKASPGKAPFVSASFDRSQILANPPCHHVSRLTLPRPPHPAPRL
jgi:hypothetical protein